MTEIVNLTDNTVVIDLSFGNKIGAWWGNFFLMILKFPCQCRQNQMDC